MNNIILFLLIIIIAIITFVLLKSSIKININKPSQYFEFNENIKKSNPDISSCINNFDIDNNSGYIDELIKKKDVNNNELYLKQFNSLLDTVPNDNSIGFCPMAKSEKKELPYANINVCLI